VLTSVRIVVLAFLVTSILLVSGCCGCKPTLSSSHNGVPDSYLSGASPSASPDKSGEYKIVKIADSFAGESDVESRLRPYILVPSEKKFYRVFDSGNCTLVDEPAQHYVYDKVRVDRADSIIAAYSGGEWQPYFDKYEMLPAHITNETAGVNAIDVEWY